MKSLKNVLPGLRSTAVKRIAASAAVFFTERIVQASRIEKEEKIPKAIEEFITKTNAVTT